MHSRKSTSVDPVKRYSCDVLAGREIAWPFFRLACERHLRSLRQDQRLESPVELYHSRAITDEDYALCIWRDTVTPDSSPTLDSGYIAAAAEANKRLRRRPTEQVILATIRELQDSNLGPTDYERVPGGNSRQTN